MADVLKRIRDCTHQPNFVAGLALVAGVGCAVVPRRLARLFRLPNDGMTGTAALGWRLSAVRELVVGGAAFAGSEPARRAILPAQHLDQAVV